MERIVITSFLYILWLSTLWGAETIDASPMTCEEVKRFVESMDSSYRPTEYEREMIMNCLLPGKEVEDHPYSSDATEWYEITTEPVTEEYVEILEPADDIVPVQEHSMEQSSGAGRASYFGSTRSIPGFHFPNYADIPLTSFNCVEKNFIPGFYADLETGCQVFHVCWPHRRESFLCPTGTTFNQALQTCDYWYNSNCSMAPHYYNINAQSQYQEHRESSETVVGSMIDTLIENSHHFGGSQEATAEEKPSGSQTETDISYISKFLPVKAKVTVYPETKFLKPKVVAEASIGKKRVKYQPKAVVKESLSQTFDQVSKDIPDIIDEIFGVAKKIVEESRGIASSVKSQKKNFRAPLHKIDPRIVKQTPVENLDSTVTSQPDVTQSSYDSRKVSPFTKRYLTDSYLKLLKNRH